MSAAAKNEVRDRFHPEAAYGGFTDIDGAMMFYSRVQALLPATGLIVDFGCGRGTQGEDPVPLRRGLRIMQGQDRKVVGLDVVSDVAANPFIDEFRLIEAGKPWPLPDACTDVVLADFVLEHVADPAQFFAEAARTLKPGGHLCIRTTNAISYVGMISRLVPNRGHRSLLGISQPRRSSGDVFDTYYRCNTVRRVRAALAEHGFDAAVYGTEPEPAYLAFSPAMYRLGLIHRRVAPASLRVGIVAWARRAR